MRVCILLLAHLGQNDAQLVRKVGDGWVRSALAPLGQLCGDRDALPPGGLVRPD